MGYYRNLETANANDASNKQGKARKKLLAFILCFVVAVLLWIIIALDKNYKSHISFYIKTENTQRTKIIADVYGQGFDILKEKLFRGRLEVTADMNKNKIIDTEELLRDSLELNEGLKYSHFKPATIELNKTP
ncbi:MAG: hypothetical protein ABI723_10415 [Bacteroidia bacterium]